MFVCGVGGGFELKRGVLDVEVPDKALLHFVEQPRDVSVMEAVIVDNDVSGQGREVGCHGPHV